MDQASRDHYSWEQKNYAMAPNYAQGQLESSPGYVWPMMAGAAPGASYENQLYAAYRDDCTKLIKQDQPACIARQKTRARVGASMAQSSLAQSVGVQGAMTPQQCYEKCYDNADGTNNQFQECVGACLGAPPLIKSSYDTAAVQAAAGLPYSPNATDGFVYGPLGDSFAYDTCTAYVANTYSNPLDQRIGLNYCQEKFAREQPVRETLLDGMTGYI